MLPSPKGFKTLTGNIGIKNHTEDDFACVFSATSCTTAALFSQNLFAGPSIQLSRQHLAQGSPSALVVISKNANVATGKQGWDHAVELTERIGSLLHIPPQDILIASTGIIGQPYPMEKIRAFIHTLTPVTTIANFHDVARAIMTTDTVPKYVVGQVGNARIIGIAKGVGMLEPHMATMLAFFFTDAQLLQERLNTIFRKVVNATFNCLSIDGDTSTSDTTAIFANGLAGAVSESEFECCLYTLALDLVKKIARDGEGATKCLQVNVSGARNNDQAKRVAKAIINSPLVKTAIHGADPNWGRIAMAIGQCEQDTDIAPDRVRIAFGEIEVYPQSISTEDLQILCALMRAEEVHVNIHLGCHDGQATVWGCDLSPEYVRINAQYST